MNLIFDIDSKSELEVTEQVNEATRNTEKKYKIKGIFSTIGEKNRNGRIYPKQLWESEISSYQDNFTNGSINTLMEWEHPSRTNVDPMQAVAKIESLKIEGNYVIGEAVLLNNEKAQQLKSLIDNGIKISVSSRGVGNVRNGIVENFKLITYDLVSDPSDYNATMNGVCESYQLNEGVVQGKNFKYDTDGNIVEVSDKDLCLFETKDIQSALKDKFADFLKNL